MVKFTDNLAILLNFVFANNFIHNFVIYKFVTRKNYEIHRYIFLIIHKNFSVCQNFVHNFLRLQTKTMKYRS